MTPQFSIPGQRLPTMLLFCHHCGYKYQSINKQCPKCGAPQDDPDRLPDNPDARNALKYSIINAAILQTLGFFLSKARMSFVLLLVSIASVILSHYYIRLAYRGWKRAKEANTYGKGMCVGAQIVANLLMLCAIYLGVVSVFFG